MSTRFWRKFGRIPLDSATAWLRRAGWSVEPDGKGGLVCHAPPRDHGHHVTPRLPQDESYADYELRLEDLIATLTVLEKRPAIQIVLEMATTQRPGGQASERLPTHQRDLVDILREALGGVLSDEQWREADELAGTLRNAVLAAEQAEDFVGNAIDAVALVAARIAHLMPPIELTKLALWRVCSRLLRNRLPLTPDELDEFWATAFADEMRDPENTRRWLYGHLRARVAAERGAKTPPGHGDVPRTNS